MNENMQKWVDELRATTLQQINGTLVELDDGEPVGACCLGIGEMVRGRSAWTLEGTDLPSTAFADWLGIEPTEALGQTDDPAIDLPDSLLPREANPSPLAPPYNLTCSMLNDGWKLTFPQIADMVAYFGLRV